jgi:hypothetical protein
LRRLVKRWWLVVAITIAAFGLLVFAYSGQRVKVANPRPSVGQAGGRLASRAPLGAHQLVFLEVRDFGYSAFLKLAGEELSYDWFVANKGALLLSYEEPDTRLVIRANTKGAINLEQSTSMTRSVRHPRLIDRLPWTYTTRGAPLEESYGPRTYSSLRHSLTITGVGSDGTVTVTVGKRRLLLRPGGELKAERSVGLWRSTVTIQHRGLFAKRRVVQSRSLRVEAD